MNPAHFKTSRLARIMSYESFMEIQRRYLEYSEIKFPNVPYRLKAKDVLNGTSDTNTLTNCIIKFLNWSGHQAERINTTGLWRNNKWSPSGSTRGSADISATIEGRSVKIEVKRGRDKQSDDQRRYQESIERSGGIYWFVYNFDEFLYLYNQIFNK